MDQEHLGLCDTSVKHQIVHEPAAIVDARKLNLGAVVENDVFSENAVPNNAVCADAATLSDNGSFNHLARSSQPAGISAAC
jgi:hypothetical protein